MLYIYIYEYIITGGQLDGSPETATPPDDDSPFRRRRTIAQT